MMYTIKKIRLEDAELNTLKLAKAIGSQMCSELDNSCHTCPLSQCTEEMDNCGCIVELLGMAIKEIERR